MRRAAEFRILVTLAIADASTSKGIQSMIFNRIGLLLSVILMTIAAASLCFAEEPAAPKSHDWNGYKALDFTVDGRNCILVVPKQAGAGKPWIWRTEFFGHEPQADIKLLGNGFHVAYIDVQNMYGVPVAMGHMDAFYAHLTKSYGLCSKVVIEGFSRGGLFAFNWAAKHPDETAALYVDAPVCDVTSWPGGKGKGDGSQGDWQQLLKVYGLTEKQAIEGKISPIDHLAPLAAAHIPILSICGGADTTVPLAENTAIVEERYKKLGGSITVIVKPGLGHHPHSLQDPTPIVDFVLKHAGCSAAQ